MSQVIPVTTLTSPAHKAKVAAAKKMAATTKVASQIKTAAATIATVETATNRVYSAFEKGGQSVASVNHTVAGLQKVRAKVASLYSQAADNLGKCIALDIPTSTALAQMQSIATLDNKIAALIVQGKASVAENADELEGLLNVDEQGYVVDTETAPVDDVNNPGVSEAQVASSIVEGQPVVDAPVNEAPETTPPTSDVDGTTIASDEGLDEGDLLVDDETTQQASDEGMDLSGESLVSELSDDEAEFDPAELDQLTAQMASEELLDTDAVEEGETASASATANLRRSTAASRSAAAQSGDDDALASLCADLIR